MLAAGIDVYSTVNVQHLETLNDSVCELTGVRVRETMPDAVLNAAEEVVLIDVTPEALLDRLREGKIYPNERIDSALNNFFKIENLNALREVALRQVAEEVESKRLVREVVGQREDRMIDSAATQAVGERLLALVKPTPRSQRLVRRAWRSAQRLAADLDLLYVRRPGQKLSDEEKEQIKAIRRLASVLGARLLIEEGDDLVQTVKDVAERAGQHLCPDRHAVAPHRPQPVPTFHGDQAHRGPSRDRYPCRRRPHAREERRMTMSTAELVIAIVLLSAVGYLLIRELQRRRTENSITPAATRILFPFAGEALSTPALDAALRLARAEGATLVPAYLAVVPLNVALDTPLKKEAEAAMPLLEAVEQRAMAAGVSVDSRIERGRTVRHALRRLIDEESFDRIVVAGATNGHDGFTSEDIAWLLEHAAGRDRDPAAGAEAREPNPKLSR